MHGAALRPQVALLALATLSGCGGAFGQPERALSSDAALVVARVSPNPTMPLLYVSDPGTNTVQVFAVGGGWVQTLRGFKQPAGECVDGAGNVYVTNTMAKNVIEYAHGGMTPIATLDDSGQLPVACAVRGATVAVANFMPAGNGYGSISIYVGGATTPTATYSNPLAFGRIDYIGYMGTTLYIAGSLGVLGIPGFQFGKMLPSGAISAIPINPAAFGMPSLPGGVQHPPGTNYVALGSTASPYIYHVSIGVMNATTIGKTTLTGTCGVSPGFYIDQPTAGQQLLYEPNPCNAQHRVTVHKYPAGGPAGTSYTTNLVHPISAVISP